jgi:hypothetical protein
LLGCVLTGEGAKKQKKSSELKKTARTPGLSCV